MKDKKKRLFLKINRASVIKGKPEMDQYMCTQILSSGGVRKK